MARSMRACCAGRATVWPWPTPLQNRLPLQMRSRFRTTTTAWQLSLNALLKEPDEGTFYGARRRSGYRVGSDRRVRGDLIWTRSGKLRRQTEQPRTVGGTHIAECDDSPRDEQR